jgi:hypothetical protein
MNGNPPCEHLLPCEAGAGPVRGRRADVRGSREAARCGVDWT